MPEESSDVPQIQRPGPPGVWVERPGGIDTKNAHGDVYIRPSQPKPVDQAFRDEMDRKAQEQAIDDISRMRQNRDKIDLNRRLGETRTRNDERFKASQQAHETRWEGMHTSGLLGLANKVLDRFGYGPRFNYRNVKK